MRCTLKLISIPEDATNVDFFLIQESCSDLNNNNEKPTNQQQQKSQTGQTPPQNTNTQPPNKP